MNRTRRIAITVSLLLGGCYSPNFREGLPCSPTGQCPEGQMCFSDGLCHSEDPGGLDAGGDGDGDSDGGVPNGPIKQVVTSEFNTCVLTKEGDVKCWGERIGLGYGPSVVENIGDDETPETVGFVPIGEPVIALSAGGTGAPVACALTESHKLFCWGSTSKVGRSTAEFGPFIGDDETPEEAGPLSLPAVNQHSAHDAGCVVAATLTPSVRCFGGAGGPVVGNPGPGADQSLLVNVGGTPARVSVGLGSACVILDDGAAKCWGNFYPGLPGLESILPEDVAGNPPIDLRG